jgi:tRNA nucleotidyltransferase/poly(A) polymerase
VGEAFGVIKVLGGRAGGEVEVVTFRRDAAYSDGRHPDAVEFSTPQADAERRDFTINGLFYDPLEDRVIDFVGGQEDLAGRVIRAIGEPRARFTEDKLRLLRAVRFAAAFDFQIEPATRAAIEEMAPQITVVSVERIAAELRLMLVHASRVRAVTLLAEAGLLAAVLPEMAAAQSHPAWDQTLRVLAALGEPSFALALAATLHGFVDAAPASDICRRLKLPNRDCKHVHWLLVNQGGLVDAATTPWPRLQRLLVSEGVDDLLALDEATAQAADRPTDGVEQCRKLLQLPPDQLDPPPLLTGDDLIAHGVKRGKQYQSLLEKVRDAQLEKQIGSKQEALALVDELLQAKPGDPH